MASEDSLFIKRTLALARNGWGKTSPNPMVGCVIVKEGRKIAEAYHQGAGTLHAEAAALQEAGSEARNAVLYVNLEPCCTTGRTSPCTEAIINAGVKRVVFGIEDPNPAHAGKATEILRSHGITVRAGVCEKACRDLNAGFFSWVTRGKPHVLLKLAMTLDGKIATASGNSKWVTGAKARDYVQHLRKWTDAVLVGGETVRLDDPRLTVRSPQDWTPQPRKLVWSKRRDIPKDYHIWADAGNQPRFIAPENKEDWEVELQKLAQEWDTGLLIEGGGELAVKCLANDVVDSIAFFYAPKILGGRASRPAIGGESPENLQEAWNIQNLKTRRLGEDVLLTGEVGGRRYRDV